MSTTEAEYVAASACCAQLLWMKHTLNDFGLLYDCMPIFCDNTSAINLTKNPIHHSRTKHIDIKYHFIRDLVQKGEISVNYVCSKEQIADIFYKSFTLGSIHSFEIKTRDDCKAILNFFSDKILRTSESRWTGVRQCQNSSDVQQQMNGHPTVFFKISFPENSHSDASVGHWTSFGRPTAEQSRPLKPIFLLFCFRTTPSPLLSDEQHSLQFILFVRTHSQIDLKNIIFHRLRVHSTDFSILISSNI